MNPISSVNPLRATSWSPPDVDREVEPSRSEVSAEPAPLPRPDAPASSPRASSTQLARFSVSDKDSSTSTPKPRDFQGAWKNAHDDVVSGVARHLPLPDRLALSQSSVAIRKAMLSHNDIAVPQSVVKAWNRLQQESDTKALDELFKYLPSANTLDKTVLAMTFVKHLDYLQSEAAQVPQELDHVYGALSGIGAEDSGKAIQLIQGLFEYGIARLPQERHTAGLERITTALQEMAAKRDTLSTLQDASALSTKLSELSDLTSIAITKFQVMPLATDDRERIGMGLLDTIRLTQVGRMRHDFAILDHTPNLKLSNTEAEGVLDTLTSSNNVQAKLDLVSGLVTHFDRLELDDAPKFVARLDVALRPLYPHGVHPDTINRLLERV